MANEILIDFCKFDAQAGRGGCIFAGMGQGANMISGWQMGFGRIGGGDRAGRMVPQTA